MYLALEHKPNNSGEIQNLPDITSGIMLRLRIVKSAAKEKAIASTAANDDVAANEGGKGMQVLLKLTEPWYHSNCLIMGDKYFAFVEAVLKLKEKDFFHWEH